MLSRSHVGSVTAAVLLALFLPIESRSARAQGHGGHGDPGAAAQQKSGGDPYLLDSDAVSGKGLGPVATQAIVVHEGREFRFANQQNADTFKANPARYIAGVDAKMIAQQASYYPLETCVVSGDKLGNKDASFEFVHQNRLVRVTSKEHMAAFLREPGKYLAKLDAAVIERQKAKYKPTTCPVSGEKLGEMGDPIDLVVGNRLVRFCCKGCLKDFDKDPLSYLGKLDGGGKEKGGKATPDKGATYMCPMHSDVVKSEPGRCPKCGMDLVQEK